MLFLFFVFLFRVQLGVELARVLGVLGSMKMMAVREMRVMRGLFVILVAVVARSLAVMLGGLFVMLGSLFVVLGKFRGVCHALSIGLAWCQSRSSLGRADVSYAHGTVTVA